MEIIPPRAKPIGYLWLVNNYKLNVIPHFRWSYIIESGARRVLKDPTNLSMPEIYLYDINYALENSDDPMQNLVFALKHEGLNLEIISAFFNCITNDNPSNKIVQKFVEEQRTGKYQRMVWYLYEKLSGSNLGIPDLKQGSYVDLLDEEEYYTAKSVQHRRYRINDNLLGSIHFCSFVRKTALLKSIEYKKLDVLARDIVKSYDQKIINRASSYLYAKETMSSYQIEREVPSKQRLARFIQLIKKVEEVPNLTNEILIKLQNSLVEDRFINNSYRITQNYVGQKRDWYDQLIHYISPKPEDVNGLMADLLAELQRMFESGVHPIVIATIISFGFVFIHPFDDGNGRLHRFLIHYILYRTGFVPVGTMFPISATILSDMQRYNEILEQFSKPLMSLLLDYDVNDDGVLTVKQETVQFYKYIDYTVQAEYLALCIEKTIHTDFKKELLYLTNYDKTKKELSQIVDMPDQQLDLFIRVSIQNNGTLSQSKRITHFKMLTDDEIKLLEAVVQKNMLDKI